MTQLLSKSSANAFRCFRELELDDSFAPVNAQKVKWQRALTGAPM
jgi:hypothetical protein